MFIIRLSRASEGYGQCAAAIYTLLAMKEHASVWRSQQDWCQQNHAKSPSKMRTLNIKKVQSGDTAVMLTAVSAVC